MRVPYGYLDRQFNQYMAEDIWQNKVKGIVTKGDFTLGEAVKDFEHAFAKFMGAKYCLGVANGTDALEIAMWSRAIPRGMEAIVPVNTFVASVASIITAGLKPVFVDTNDKFVIDVDKIQEKITEKTAVLLPVHFGGQPCDMITMEIIAEANNLTIIEDAAQAAGAMSNAGPCGSIGALGCVSFHPQKNLNCWGDGGAILTDEPGHYEDLLLYRNHGMLTRDDYAFASRNSRLDSIHAAVLSHFLPKLHADNQKRIQVAKKYDQAFKKNALIPQREDEIVHTYHLYLVEMHSHETRNDLLKYLNYFGIEAKIHYPKPLHLQPAFKHLGYKEGDFPNAERQAKNMISLPIHQYMESAEIDYVCEKIGDFFK